MRRTFAVHFQLRLYLEVQKKILAELSELQERAIAQDLDLIVWPETAFPGFVSRDKKQITRFESFKKPTVIGAITAGDKIAERGSYTYDSALLINGDGSIMDIYDKMHLIPIAEFLPWVAKFIQCGEQWGLRVDRPKRRLA